MKKLVLLLFISTFFINCFAQVTIYKKDGSTIEGSSCKVKKDVINYGTGTISKSEVLFMKYRSNYFCMLGKKQDLSKLKKSFNPDIKDKNSMAILFAHKYFKCNCDPQDSDPEFKKLAEDKEFMNTYNAEQKRIKTSRTVGFIGGFACGLVVTALVYALVIAAV
jgi:hypothetical protein